MTVPVITEDLTIKVRAIERDLHFVKEVTDADLGDNIIYNYHITTGSVTSDSIANATITGGDISSATIVGSNIANGTITGTQIGNAVISGSHIASATITGTNIASATITGGNISLATITGSNLVNATITATQIANATITGTQIATATITGTHIQDASIQSNHIGSLAITSAMITDLTIQAIDIANNTITATKIANNTITAGQIANNTITATQIANNTISAGQIVNQTITATQIANNTITASQLLNNTITALQIANNTITAGQIANNTITTGQIASNTITAGNILDLTITASEIADLTITGAKIVAGTLDASKITVTSLSALSANLGTITAGTITGATFQTSASNPRVFMDSTGIGAVNSTGTVTFKADASTGKVTTLAGIGGFNLARNSSAEDPAINEAIWYTDGVGGWWLQDVGTSKFTRQVRTDTKHGNYCFKVNRTSGTGSVGLVQDHDPVAFGPAREGEVFSASAHFQSYVGSGHDAQVWIQFLTSGLGHIQEVSSQSVAVSTNSWTRVYLDNVTAPATTAYVRVKCFGFNLAVNNEILVDAIQLEQGPISTYYSPSPYDILPNAVQTWQQNTALQPGLVGTYWRITASPPASVENGPPIYQEIKTNPGAEQHNYNPGGTGTTNWSARYTGFVKNKNFNGNVTFHVYTDDGARLRVNGQTLIGDSAWISQGVTKYSGTINLAANEYYSIAVDHFQGGSAEDFYLAWESGGWGEQLIPAENLFHTGSVGAAQIQPETVTLGTIAARAVLADSVATDAITTRALAADSVAADNIAANAISARSLAVGAMSDNLITNWSAEGGNVDGWGVVENSGGPASLAPYNNTGAHGAWIFGLQFQGGGNTAYGHKAVPVIPGRKYMFKFHILHDNGTGTHYVRMNEKNNAPTGGDYITASNRTSNTDFISGVANSTITSWQQKEFVYTVPAGITYVSPSFYNWGGTSGTLHFDAVEFREQVKGVAIADGAITANKLVIGATGWDRIMVRGSNQEAAILGNTGGFAQINGVTTHSAGSTGLTVDVYNRATHAFISHTSYSNYFNDTESNNMASALNALGNDRVVFIYSNDAWGPPTTNLKAAMRRCGASSAIDKPTGSRSSYALIGWPGMGEGNGVEAAGVNPATPTNWHYAEAYAQWVDGEIQGANAGLTNSTIIYGGNIAADAIDGKVITGATLRTAATGSRVNIDSAGLKAYNATDETYRLSSSDGGTSFSVAEAGTTSGVPQPTNPSADTNTTGWTPTVYSTLSRVTSSPTPHSGPGAFLIEGTSVAGNGRWLAQMWQTNITGSFNLNTKYALKVWLQRGSTLDEDGVVTITWGATWQANKKFSLANLSAGSWSPIIVEWTPLYSTETNTVDIYFDLNTSSQASCKLYVDSIELVKVEIPDYRPIKFEDPIGSIKRGAIQSWNFPGEDNAIIELQATPDTAEAWHSRAGLAIDPVGDTRTAEFYVENSPGEAIKRRFMLGVKDASGFKYANVNLYDSKGNSDFMLSKGHHAKVIKTSAQSIPNAAWTSVSWSSQKYEVQQIKAIDFLNPSNHWVSGNNTRLTCAKAGFYLITTSFGFDASAAGVHRLARIFLNGVTSLCEGGTSGVAFSTGAPRLNMSSIEYLRYGDYIEIQAYQDSGAGLNVLADTSVPNNFSISRIGDAMGLVIQ